jgi:RNA polymerase sigma factor (sigma-70 family)
MLEPPDERFGLPRARTGHFHTTQWSLVLAAGGTDREEAGPALERLVQTYWYPLYTFIRRQGMDAEEAIDLTQEFLARLLEKNFLGAADPARGRFRTFLLTALERFLANEWARRRRQKRGGGRPLLSLDVGAAEERYRLEPAHTLTAERLYERRWAMTILESAMARLGEECSQTGRAALFEAARAILAGEPAGTSYAEIGARLGMSEGAVKTAVHRMRRRYGEILRWEIAETVGDPREVDEEIRQLFTALAVPAAPR